MKIISVTNQKGGVGKSTHAIHLAEALRTNGYRVLFVDCDTQGNSSSYFDKNKSGISASTLFDKECDGNKISDVYKEDLALIYADSNLANVPSKQVGELMNFHENINGFQGHYDFCIIDTPPQAGFLLKAVVFGSHYNIMPMELKQWAIDGTIKMLQTLKGMSDQKCDALGEPVEFLGIFINMFDKTDKNQAKSLEQLEKVFAKYLLFIENTDTKETARISKKNVIEYALNLKVPVWKYNQAQNEITSKASLESAKEFTIMYKALFPKIEAEFIGFTKEKGLKNE